MSWGTKRIAGIDYDLRHLDPFIMQVMAKGENPPVYDVRVSFGCHTFTREVHENDTPDLHFRSGRELRCFCTDRHRYSLELPDMIRYAANGRAYFSERANFLVVEIASGTNVPYVAFFYLEKAKRPDRHDVSMFVTSAHLKPGLPEKLPAVTFPTLIDYHYRGAALRRPEPRKILLIKRK
jgi:hypothetical protein